MRRSTGDSNTWEGIGNSYYITPLKSGKMRLGCGWYGYLNNPNKALNNGGTRFDIVTKPNLIRYDVQDGNLKIYKDGSYRIGNGQKQDPIYAFPEDKSFYIKVNRYKNTDTSNSYGTSPDGDETHTGYYFSNDLVENGVQYVEIPGSDFPYEGYHAIHLYSTDDHKKLGHLLNLNVTDRNFVLQFKMNMIELDRSKEGSLWWQLDPTGSKGVYYGQDLQNYVTPPTGNIIPYKPVNLYFYLNNFRDTSYVQTLYGNVLCLEGGSNFDYIRGCTWKKNKQDTIYVRYGNPSIFNNNVENGITYGQDPGMVVKVIQSDPSVVYLRGITDTGYNHNFNVGQEYTLRDLIGFYPGDSTNFQLIMSKVAIREYDESAIEVNVSSNTPSTWHGFYDLYLRLKILKKGRYTISIWWETIGGIGGSFTVYLFGVDDGTGKPQSSSGVLTPINN
jgi:hypothetical protein